MLFASRNFNRTYVRLKLRPGNLLFLCFVMGKQTDDDVSNAFRGEPLS